MRFSKISVFFELFVFLALCSCQQKPAQQTKSPEPAPYTIEDWKKELLSYMDQTGERAPEGAVPLSVEISTYPYFIVYANLNNNEKPDAIFAETWQRMKISEAHDSAVLHTRRLYIYEYEWDNQKWNLLLGADRKGIYTPQKHWLKPSKDFKKEEDWARGIMDNSNYYQFSFGRVKFCSTPGFEPTGLFPELGIIGGFYFYWTSGNVYKQDFIAGPRPQDANNWDDQKKKWVYIPGPDYWPPDDHPDCLKVPDERRELIKRLRKSDPFEDLKEK
ncbi:hypothetical protein HY772_01360 [Candidatus Woesearchaeota archaeon]|nr:hypothetical protein [Candidatus Woesearchaeota archaeon]